MDFIFGGCHTTHPKGCFCSRIVAEHYFITYFETPFQYEWNGVLYNGSAGDMLIQPPGSVIYHGHEELGFVNTWVYGSNDVLETLLEKYPLPLNTSFAMVSGDLLEQYVLRATEEFKVQSAGFAEILKSITTQLIIDLHRRYHRIGSTIGKLEALREEFLSRPEKTWDLSRLASRCGYSVSRFCALYKSQFGVSPKQEILSARVALAQNMLRYTDRTVADIAETCGFTYTPYFTKYFKSVTGLSPREYRKNKMTALY